MTCFHPLRIKDVKTGLNVLVPCGKCVGCLAKKRDDWSFRLQVEHRHSDLTILFTLTYNDKNVPVKLITASAPSVTDDVVRFGSLQNSNDYVKIVHKRDIQTFIKRFRFNNPFWNVRYFITAEYGPTTLRPHYHGLFFIKKSETYFGKDKNSSSGKKKVYKRLTIESVGRAIESAWCLNNSPIGFVSYRSPTSLEIGYTCKYVTKEMETSTPTDTWQVMSKKPYLGYQFVNTATFNQIRSEYHERNGYLVIPKGKSYKPLPRIYLRKTIPTLYSSAYGFVHERYQQISPLLEDIVTNGDFSLYDSLDDNLKRYFSGNIEERYVNECLSDPKKMQEFKKRLDYQKKVMPQKEAMMKKKLSEYWKYKTEKKEKIMFNKKHK